MILINNNKNSTETNPEFAYRVIKENILSLVLRPGDSISETELSGILNISRTPIREALVHLKKENLINVYPQKGTFISLLDFNLIEEAVFMRTILEQEVISLATSNFPDLFLIKLEKNLLFQKKITEFSTSAFNFFDLDNKFHEIIFTGCGKPNIWKQIQIISSHFNRVRLLDAMNRKSLNSTFEEHLNIYNAIKEKNSELANSIIKGHILNFYKELEVLFNKYPHFFTSKVLK